MTNIGTASGTDDDGRPVSDSDDETVTILDVSPSAVLTKTVTRLCATYEVKVVNTSIAEALSLASLVDHQFGDLDGIGDCDVPQTIPAGGRYICALEGCPEDPPLSDTVTGTVSDNEGGAVTPSDGAEVTFGKPVIQ